MKNASRVAGVAVVTLEDVKAVVTEAIAEGLADLPANDTDRLLDRRGCAAFLGCSLTTLDKVIADGLPYVVVGDSKRFAKAEVVDYLRARRAGGA